MLIIENSPKIAAYCRVSTDEQKINLNIDIQKTEIEKYVCANGLKLDYLYLDDGISGAVPFAERPQGSLLLKDAKANKFKKVFVLRIDRIGRDAVDTMQLIRDLKKYDIEVKSTTENTEDKLVLHLLAAIAEKERETITQRMTLGINRAANLGKWVGGVIPYGYCLDKEHRLAIYDKKDISEEYSEAEIVRKIFCLIAGGMTCEKVALLLNDKGIPTRSAKNNHLKRKQARCWIGAAIRQLIVKEIYKGVNVFGKKSKDPNRKITYEVEALVDENTWNKAQAALKGNMIKSLRNTKREYLLTGKIKCSECNRNFTGLAYKECRYYACNNFRLKNKNNPVKCINGSIRADILGNEIWKDILEFINNPDLIIEFINNKLSGGNGFDINLEIASRRKKLEKLSVEKSKLIKCIRFGNSFLEKDIMIEIEKIKNEECKLVDEINYYSDLASDKEAENQKIMEIKRLLSKFSNHITNPSFKLKKEIIRLLVKEVIVHPKNLETKSRDIEISYCFNKDITITKLSLKG